MTHLTRYNFLKAGLYIGKYPSFWQVFFVLWLEDELSASTAIRLIVKEAEQWHSTE